MGDIFDIFKKLEKERITGGSTAPEFIIAGLGNPGDKYAETRHNAGFMAMDYFCQKYNCDCKRLKFKAMIGEATLAGRRGIIMKPQTFMNNSGEAISACAEFYKIPPEKIIVIVDDINLAVGRMRIRGGGSAGGHNGLASIIYHLESDSFPRIRLGVGAKPSPDYDLADWVLGRMPKNDLSLLLECLAASCEAAEMILGGELDSAMGKYNGFRATLSVKD